MGAGAIVEDAHLPTLLAMEDVHVAWVTDTSEARAAQICAMYGVASLPPGDFARGISGVDVCLLAIPAGARAPYIDACAARGVAVVCEKPFGRDLVESEARAAKFPSERVAVCMQRKYLHTTELMRHFVKTRPLGRLSSIALSMGGFDLKSGGANRYLTSAALAGGGVLIEYGIHGLDQIVEALGVVQARVRQCKSILRGGMDYEVVFQSEVEFEQGSVRVQSEMTRLRPLLQGVWLVFEDGRIHLGMSPDGPVRATSSSGRPVSLDTRGVGGATTSRQAFYFLWRDFFAGLESGVAPRCAAEHCMVTARWIEQTYNLINSQNRAA